MIELSHQDENTLKMGFAGDTLNTSVYLARYTDQINLNVFYATALGYDPYSTQMMHFWHQEGIQTQWVTQIQNKLPGLYFIKTDDQGERSFYFYRSVSAARQFFHVTPLEELKQAFLTMNYVYFSGVGLAIWDEFSRDQLFKLIYLAKQQGAIICFDSNYRSSLWSDTDTARYLIEKACSFSDIYLPTFEDHKLLFNDETPESLAHRLTKFDNLKEIVIKAGEKGCCISSQGKIQWVSAHTVKKVIDTTGAGDSFNAGYLASRIKGLKPEIAAQYGHLLASQVISYPGAIIPKSKMPTLF